MLFLNARVAGPDFDFIEADLLVKDGRIAKIAPRGTLDTAGEEILNCAGKTVLPGFVDIHIHGCNKADTGNATPQALETMSRFLASKGVTSFCPTSMTVSHEDLKAVFGNIRDCARAGLSGAVIRGINMEGPYISVAKKGAQAATHVRVPDIGEFNELNEWSGGLVRIVDIAPEEPGAEEFIRAVSPGCTVSLAHSTAGYEQTKKAFDAGLRHATHLFNQMTPLAHREPGAVGAFFDDDRPRAELICDGFHVHPAALRIAFRALGEDRSCAVSDAMEAAGCPVGEYVLGGQTVLVRDSRAFLADGTIAGSTTNLYDEFRNLLSYGVPLRQALKSCTVNNAREIRAEDEIGSIAEGKRADLLVMGDGWTLEKVFIGGKLFV